MCKSPYNFQIIFLIFLLVTTGNLTHAQESFLGKNIYLDTQTGTIQHILSEIEIAGGFIFSYGNIVPEDKNIHLKGGNRKVQEFLDEILAGVPVMYVEKPKKILIVLGPLHQSVRGIVKDLESGSPLTGATLQILETGPMLGVITDTDGYFHFEKVPVGRINIYVNFLGYQEASLRDILVGSGKEVFLDVGMIETFINIEELSVNPAKWKSEPNNDLAAVSARSFTVEETKRYPAAVNDPARMALVLPGVTTGDEDIFNELVIRSNSPARVLWRMEGIDIPPPNHFAMERNTTGWVSMISSNLLGKSDFITGAFPAEYGNTTSGVFDISLRNGNNRENEYSFQFGALGTDLALEGPFSENYNGSYLVNFRYSILNPMIKMGMVDLENYDEIKYWDLSYKIHLPTRNAGNFSLWGIGGSGEAIANKNSSLVNIASSGMATLGLTHVYMPNDKSYLKSVIALSLNNTEDDNDTLEIEDYTLNTLKASLVYRYKFNRLSVKLGSTLSQHIFDYVQSGPYPGKVDSKGNTFLYQGFAQGKYSLTRDIYLIAGFHYLHFALNGNSSMEPRVGLKWNFAKKQSFGLGIGKHSQTEYLSTYFQQVEQDDGSYTTPNKELDLTKSIHYVISYDNTLIKNIHFKTELYYQDLYDVPVMDHQPHVKAPFNNEHPMKPLVNSGTGRNFGIEFTVEKYFSRGYYFLASSSLYDSKIDPGNDTLYNSSYNAGFSQNIVGGKEIRIGRNKQNLIGVNAKILWTGGNRGQLYNPDNTMVVPARYEQQYMDYFRMDVNLSYRINRPRSSHVFSLDIQNVTNRGNIVRINWNFATGKFDTDYQTGRFPFFSYKVEF
ncbi:carboxypeptidase regulatory-like domain-containing protein [Bacteroidota bacterium]